MVQTYTIKDEVTEYLESWDCPVTKDNICRVLSEWISNLKSHIGKEAHEREALYVEDLTGMTWEEQDAYALEKIKRCEEYMKELCGTIKEAEE